MNAQLDDFSRQVRERIEKIKAAKGKKAEKLQIELSTFVGEQMQELMKQGLSAAEILKPLWEKDDEFDGESDDELKNNANDEKDNEFDDDDEFDDEFDVEWDEDNEFADEFDDDDEFDDESDDDDEFDDMYIPPLYIFLCFLPMKDKTIDAFAAGKLNENDMMKQLRSSPDITALHMMDGLELVLTDYGKNPSMKVSDGEIVVGSDGEDFMPKPLDVRQTDYFIYGDPMMFQTPKEVEALYGSLKLITQKDFFKKANIKKLLKCGWMEDNDPKEILEDADIIISQLWEEFVRLQEVYKKATEKRCGMAIFTNYKDVDSEDDKE